jgi:Uncharacterized conserved protein containing a coiled-coil domain
VEYQEKQKIKQTLIELLQTDEELRRIILEIILPAEIKQMLDELRQFREDSNKMFEAMDKRFEALIKEMNERFQQVDKRFEALIKEMNERFQQVDKRFEALIKEMTSLRVEVSALGGRLGRGFEDVIRQTLSVVAGVEIKEVKRLIMWDDVGEVYGHPENVEFDAYASNGQKFLIEVKSFAKREDVLMFSKKATWAEKKLGQVNKILIAAYIDDDAYRICSGLGIIVVSRNIVPKEPEEILRL